MARFEAGQYRLLRAHDRVVLIKEVRSVESAVEVYVEDLLGEWGRGWIHPYSLSDPLNEMEVLAWAAR